jgi:hypothetical protein
MPTKDILFPMLGVVRRNSLRSAPDTRGPWPTPWAVNVRVEDNLDRRLRGGSRPGLTKFVSDDFGSVIADMASIHLSSSAGGATEVLLVLVDSSIKTVEGGTVTTQVAYLTDESGNILTDANENRIVVSSGSAPSNGFLVTGQQRVFAVTTSGVTRMDPKTGQVDALAASAGTIPTNCTFGAVYRDRLCLSGQDNAIYMSRQKNYTDWAYGKSVGDEGRAVPFQLSLGADVGPKPTAMIPCMDSYLLCGTARSLWVVQGDPTAGGALKRVSETVGIIGSRAWTKVDQSIVFLSSDGLYSVGADGSDLKLMSDAIPDELRSINVSTTTVSLGYDQDRSAFHIYLRTSGGSDTHWLYEPVAEAFWPMRLQNTHSPLVVCQHGGDMLLAGSDGYIRTVTGTNDDGAGIQSHVALGPFRLGQPGFFGRMINMHAMLAAGGGRVNWRIVTGDSAEECADNVKTAIEAFQAGTSYSSYVKASGNWGSGRAIMSYPRVRAVWCCLWLQSTDRWAFEGLTVETVLSGMWRGSSSGLVTAGVVSPSSSPSASPTATPSASRSTSPSTSPSATVSSSPSASVSNTPSTSPSASVSNTPSSSPSPSASVSSSPSRTPSSSVSSSPSSSRSTSPSASQSASPSSTPSASPSTSPSASRSTSPSSSPSST